MSLGQTFCWTRIKTDKEITLMELRITSSNAGLLLCMSSMFKRERIRKESGALCVTRIWVRIFRINKKNVCDNENGSAETSFMKIVHKSGGTVRSNPQRCLWIAQSWAWQPGEQYTLDLHAAHRMAFGACWRQHSQHLGDAEAETRMVRPVICQKMAGLLSALCL